MAEIIEYASCCHCGNEIGHRKYTRSWEHLFEQKDCKKPWKNKEGCFCDECDPDFTDGVSSLE